MKGFQAISQEWNNDHINAVLQQMFPDSLEDDNVDHVRTLTETYHRYKRKYVQQLSLDPRAKNLCKYTFGGVFFS